MGEAAGKFAGEEGRRLSELRLISRVAEWKGNTRNHELGDFFPAVLEQGDFREGDQLAQVCLGLFHF